MNKEASLKIYLAAPLFNEQERSWNRALRNALASFADVFLPQEDGALLVELIKAGLPYPEARARIFASDLKALERIDLIVAVLDGRSIDEGVAFELGVAFALGKLCWGLKTDDRVLLRTGDNPMIEGALGRCFSSLPELISALSELSRSRRLEAKRNAHLR